MAFPNEMTVTVTTPQPSSDGGSAASFPAQSTLTPYQEFGLR